MSEAAGIIGTYAGALLITFFTTRAIRKLLGKRMNKTSSALVAFVIVGLISLIIAGYTMGVVDASIVYLPCLLLWLIIDLTKRPKEKLRNN